MTAIILHLRGSPILTKNPPHQYSKTDLTWVQEYTLSSSIQAVDIVSIIYWLAWRVFQIIVAHLQDSKLSFLDNILPWICVGFFVFCGGDWGAAADAGGQHPALNNIVTYSMYISIMVKYFMYTIHTLPQTFPCTFHPLPWVKNVRGLRGFHSICPKYMDSRERGIHGHHYRCDQLYISILYNYQCINNSDNN